jgi:hypothetical protein
MFLALRINAARCSSYAPAILWYQTLNQLFSWFFCA